MAARRRATSRRGRPEPLGSRLAAGGLVLGNLLLLVPLLRGDMSTGDILVVYWLENVAVWALTIVKVATARGMDAEGRTRHAVLGVPIGPASPRWFAGFFALHYGVLTLAHAAFVWVLVDWTDSTLHLGTCALLGLALGATHGVSLVRNWFGQGERDEVSAGRAMTAPYARIVVLHAVVLGSCWLLIGVRGPLSSAQAVLPALLLVLGKTGSDLGLHRRERLRSRIARQAATPSPPPSWRS